MNFRQMIEAAEIKTGTVRALAKQIGVIDANISSAKRGARGIPDEACAKLAHIIDLPWSQVQAARNAWIAKTDEERKFWHPFVMGRAAMIFASSALIGITALPSESHAGQGFSNNSNYLIGIM